MNGMLKNAKSSDGWRMGEGHPWPSGEQEPELGAMKVWHVWVAVSNWWRLENKGWMKE